VTAPLTLRLPSDPKYLPLVRAVVHEGAELAGFDQELTHRILLAVTEAMTNVIRHVYNGSTEQRIDMELTVGEGRLDLALTDYGEFVDPKKIASRPLGDVRPGGLGVHLIQSTMDKVEYRKNAHGGTTLTLVKHAPAHKESS
jgi:anti-sigma regulatory factor (Ser/Thr protein kinase)